MVDSDLSSYYLNYAEKPLDGEGKTNITLVSFTHSSEWPCLPEQCVLKRVPDSQKFSQNEAQIHTLLSRRVDGIVKLYFYHHSPQEQLLFMEYCSQYNLSSIIEDRAARNKPWSDSELLTNFTRLATVLVHIHKLSYCHRDVKPANIFVKEDGTLKVGDFGDAALFAQSRSSLHGSKAYMDPAVYFAYFHGLLKGELDYMKSDVFALGKVFYEMATLSECQDFEPYFLKESEAEFQEMLGQALASSKFLSIILGMLRFDSRQRWSSAQCLEALHSLRDSAFIYNIDEFPGQDEFIDLEEEEPDSQDAATIIHYPR